MTSVEVGDIGRDFHAAMSIIRVRYAGVSLRLRPGCGGASAFGAEQDQGRGAATGLVGVNRQSLTDADADGRNLVVSWMNNAGLDVRIDQMGNIFGRREGTNADAAPVMSASHIDTVATGGAFDGCLGVLGALEVVRSLNDARITTRRPIVIAAFTEEEGVRFGTDMLAALSRPGD